MRCRPLSICCASCAQSRPPKSRNSCSLLRPIQANPYGSVLRWPDLPVAGRRLPKSAPRVLTRAAYAEVILRNGQLVAWLSRGNPHLARLSCPPRNRNARRPPPASRIFCARADRNVCASAATRVSLITTINGQPVAAHPMARFLMDAGFHPGPLGMHLRRILIPIHHDPHAPISHPRNSNKTCPKATPSFALRAPWAARLSASRSPAFRSTLPAAHALQRRHAARRPDRRSRGGARQMAADPFLRRRHSCHAHADERLAGTSTATASAGEPARNMRIVHREQATTRPSALACPSRACYTAQSLARDLHIPPRGADVLSEEFDAAAALERLPPCAGEEIGDVLLASAGAGRRGQRLQVGNLFCRQPESVSHAPMRSRAIRWLRSSRTAQHLLAANVLEDSGDMIVTYRGQQRRTTHTVGPERESVGIRPRR